MITYFDTASTVYTDIFFKFETKTPGRLGTKNVYRITLGSSDVYFYMTPEKDKLMREFLKNVNEDLLMTVVSSELEFPVLEVTPTATVYLEPDESNPQFDQKGLKILKNLTQHTQKIAESALGIKMKGEISSNMSLVYSQDNMKYHQDQCPAQYKSIQKTGLPLPKYFIAQDLSLIDWEMSKGTFSGTLIQPQNDQDRFILTLFPEEVVGTFYVEQARYIDSNTYPEYPGADTLPPHTPFAPVDFSSNLTPGSTKGTRISTVVRSLLEEEDVNQLKKNSEPLPLDVAIVTKDSQNCKIRSYGEGITFRELPFQLDPFDIKSNLKYPDQEDVEICMTPSKDHDKTIKQLMDLLEIKAEAEKVTVRHLIKRGCGFSELGKLDLGASKDSQIVFVNRSIFPNEGFHFCNMANLSKGKNLPWIHLYHFPPSTILSVPYKALSDLALTPMEEIFFRDANWDIKTKDLSVLSKKLVTRIDAYIFN